MPEYEYQILGRYYQSWAAVTRFYKSQAELAELMAAGKVLRRPVGAWEAVNG